VILCIRRLYILCAVIFVAGIACGISAASLQSLAAAVLVLCIAAFATARSLKGSLRNTILLTSIFAAAFFYGAWRAASAHCTQLEKYSGRSVVLGGALEKSLPSSDRQSSNFIFRAEYILFPKREAVNAPVFLCVRCSDRESKLKAEQLLNHPLQVTALVRKGSPDDLRRSTMVAMFCKDTDLKQQQTGTDQSTGRNMRSLEPMLEIIRSKIAEAHVKVLNEQRGCLLTSIVLGDRATKLPSQLVNDFRAVGLSHVLAASGFNLTLIISSAYFIAGSAITGDKKRGFFALLVMACYILLTGLSASIVRAAIMCSFVIVARMIRRQVHLTTSLVTALMATTLVDPLALTDIGLQLSYAATLGISLGAKQFSELVQLLPTRTVQIIAESVAVCTMAQLAVLPIQAFTFCSANALFLPSNLLVLPLIAPLTVLGFVSTLIFLASQVPLPTTDCFFGVAASIDSLMGVPLDYMLGISHSLASISWARILIAQPHIAQVAIYYFLLVLAVAGLHRSWSRIIPITLMVSATLTLVYRVSGPAVSLGIFPDETIIVGREQTAFSISSAQQKDSAADKNNGARERFLSRHGVGRTLSATPLRDSKSFSLTSFKSTLVCIDHRTQIAVVALQGEQELFTAQNQQFALLGALAGTSKRYLIVRFDGSGQSQGKHIFEGLKKAQTLMGECAIERGIFVYNRKQYKQLRYFIYTLSKLHDALDPTIEIFNHPGLTIVTLEREQLDKIVKRDAHGEHED
jgi:ComEC/Rec2-related protein